MRSPWRNLSPRTNTFDLACAAARGFTIVYGTLVLQRDIHVVIIAPKSLGRETIARPDGVERGEREKTGMPRSQQQASKNLTQLGG